MFLSICTTMRRGHPTPNDEAKNKGGAQYESATFILPRFSHRPSIFREPRRHLKLLWRGFRFYLRDLVGCVVFKFAGPEPGWFGRSFKIARSKIVPTALALHKQMYSSFAEGDIAAVRKTCTDGLYETLRARIATRGKGRRFTGSWSSITGGRS
ncbi:hypothetical protein LSUB1_G008964, partial [Lachnellula subtilissima]